MLGVSGSLPFFALNIMGFLFRKLGVNMEVSVNTPDAGSSASATVQLGLQCDLIAWKPTHAFNTAFMWRFVAVWPCALSKVKWSMGDLVWADLLTGAFALILSDFLNGGWLVILSLFTAERLNELLLLLS